MAASPPPPLLHPRLWFTLQFAGVAAVGVLSLLPAPDMGGSDKLLHFFAYGLMSGGFALLLRRWPGRLWAALGVAAYGVLLEYLQGLTGYRMFDPADMLANGAGVLAGLILGWRPLVAGFYRLEQKLGVSAR